ncbi:MAG: hypothetical protein KF696_14600 [Planctomycetes bacterium]|nr:hypothetical protein [Planctomycetota bacterium]MCW8137152.1 hypothetical protein [Planctomycetota bacterium]
MTANPWLLSIHVISLIVWIGNLLALSGLMAFAARQEAPHTLFAFASRGYRTAVMPAGALAILTGLLMLHGVGSTNFASVGEAIRHHLFPRTPQAEPSFWYVTFHVKLVAVTVLFLADLWLGISIGRMARGRNAPAWPLGPLLALTCVLVAMTTTWLLLSSLGMPQGRQVGFALGFALAVPAFWYGRRMHSPARFDLAGVLIGALALLIVVLVVAKPLAYGAPL